MITISNQDRDNIIRYLELMIENTADQNGLRIANHRRMARFLIEKLSAKQSFSLSALPEDIRTLLKK